MKQQNAFLDLTMICAKAKYCVDLSCCSLVALLGCCRLPYAGYFGGVSGLSKKQFLKINGFPNEYWGWGGEDDDIYNRSVDGCTA